MSDWPIVYSSEERNDWFLWQLQGRLDRTTAEEAAEEGEKLLAGRKKFALDLSRLDYLSSAGIRTILKLARAAEKQSITFAVISPGGMVKEVLETSRLDMFMDICSALEELDA